MVELQSRPSSIDAQKTACAHVNKNRLRSVVSSSSYFFLAAFFTADFAGATGFALVATGFTAAVFLAVLRATAFAEVFFEGADFLAAGATAAGAFFLTAFSAVDGLALVAFFVVLPPKIPSQPPAYFSFVPTRVIVTESPFNRN